MKQIIELRPNRDLLDRDFNGYKLSLDPVTIYDTKLDADVVHAQPADNQYSYAHVRIFSLHNHLHFNPHTPKLVYFVDDGMNVNQVSIGLMNRCEGITRVCEIPHPRESRSGDFPVTIQFVSAERAIISDGTGTYHVAATKKDKWVIVFSDTLTPEGTVLLSALQTNNELHILFRSVVEPKFDSVLHLLTLDENWQTVATKKIQVSGNVQHCALEAPGIVTLVTDGKKYPKFLAGDAAVPDDEPKYKWSQTSDDIIMIFVLTEDGSFLVQNTEQNLTVTVNEQTVIDGKFAGEVKNVKWLRNEGKLEITAEKVECGIGWKQVIEGDDCGEQYQSECVAEEDGTFNAEELEEVDVASPATLLRLDAAKSDVSHEIDFSTQQYLFSVVTDGSKPPAVCIRHLTDACVWQFHTQENNWTYSHIGTFSAFGYVQASKTQRKFIVAPENLSYVVIADAFRHLYIFRQPSPVNGTLRNRTSGTRVNAVARQQLVNLECADEILGICATNTLLFVLTKRNFYALVINDSI